jgi:polygalacturonase
MIQRQIMIFCGLALSLMLSIRPAAAQPAERRYIISDFGAVGDGTTVNTKALQALIDRIASQGGGVVVVPKGTFVTGALFFKQGVNLQIEKDAVLKATGNLDDYPQIRTRWEGIEREWTSAFLNFEGMKNVEVGGGGTIDGAADLFPARPTGRGAATRPAGAAPATQQAAGARRGRPRMICFSNCDGVKIANLNLQKQAVWCLHILYSQNVVVENLIIRSVLNTPSSDGIDVDSSKNVRIANVDIDCNDDCISIKSGKDEDGRRVNRPSEDIIVENSRFGFGHGGVAMGSETSGGIRNVEIRNCVFEDGNLAPIRFKSQPSRGGVVENITYRDLKLSNTRQAFEFNMEWRMVPPIAPPAKVLPVVRNVKIINVSGTTSSAGIIHGLKDSPIQGVTFENCDITAQRGLRIENAVGVDTSGLKIKVSQGEPIILRPPATRPGN